MNNNKIKMNNNKIKIIQATYNSNNYYLIKNNKINYKKYFLKK